MFDDKLKKKKSSLGLFSVCNIYFNGRIFQFYKSSKRKEKSIIKQYKNHENLHLFC